MNSEDILSSANLSFPNDPYTCETAVLGMKNAYITEEKSNNDETLNEISEAGDSLPATIGDPTNVLTEINNFRLDIPGRNDTHYIKYIIKDGKYVKVWECGICRKDFGHQYTLLRHLPTHTDERKYQCTTCGKAFRQMSTLCQHKAIHSVARPYKCTICQKSFNRVSTLMSHKKTHSGYKPHKCVYCHKAFHQKGNLRNHVFTHTNERPYKCEVCAKGFNQMSNLMCHKLKAHAGTDKPRYKCQHCDKEFSKRIAFRNHELYEHHITNGSDTIVSSAASSTSELSSPCKRNNVPLQSDKKYSGGIVVDPITTDAMLLALQTKQTAFVLLKPLNGMPAIVRVEPIGNKHLLLPVTWEELRNQCNISLLDPSSPFDESPDKNTEISASGDRVKIQVKIPIVATLKEMVSLDQTLCMEVINPGPKQDMGDGNIIYSMNTRAEEPQTVPSTFFQDTTTKPYSMKQITDELELVNKAVNMLNEGYNSNAHFGQYNLNLDDAFMAQSFEMSNEVAMLGQSNITPVTNIGDSILNPGEMQLTDLDAQPSFDTSEIKTN